MKQIISILLFLSLVFIGQNSRGQNVSSEEEFQKSIKFLAAQHGVPGMSYAILKDGRVVSKGAFGMANEEKGEVATLDTPYPIASVTKTFSSTIGMRLLENNKIDFNRKINSFAPEMNFGESSLKDVFGHFSIGDPGSFYMYTSRFGKLDHVITKAIEGSFHDEFGDLIAELGMDQTFGIGGENFLSTPEHRETLAEGYSSNPDGSWVASGHPALRLNGGNGLITTVNDLVKFTIAHDRNELLKKESYDFIETPIMLENGRPSPYGFGWFRQKSDDLRLMWHMGAWPTATAFYIRDLNSGYTLILLTNSDGPNTPYYFIGTGDVTTSPFARTFFRYIDRELGQPVFEEPDWEKDIQPVDHPFGIPAIFGRAVLASWQGNAALSDKLLTYIFENEKSYLENLPEQALAVHLGQSQNENLSIFMRNQVERSLENYPENIEARFYLADHYSRYGMVKKATFHYNELLAYPNTGDVPGFMTAMANAFISGDKAPKTSLAWDEGQ